MPITVVSPMFPSDDRSENPKQQRRNGMDTKVRHFHNSGACSVFTLEDGSVRMLGSPGTGGAFGFYSKGRHTVSNIANGTVTIQTIKDNKFSPPPQDMGKVIECVTDGNTTYAINDEGTLFAWGYMRQKDHKILPFGKKIKRIIRLGWDQTVFVTASGENILFHRREGEFYNKVEAELESVGALKYAVTDSSMRLYIDEGDNLLAVYPPESSLKGNEPPVVKLVRDCAWAICADSIYYQTKDGKTHRAHPDKYSSVSGRWGIFDMWTEKNPILFDAIGACESGSRDGFSFLHENNTIHTHFPSWRKDDAKKVSFDKAIKQFDNSCVLLENGMVMPISENEWTRTDMVLAAFPEWQDDEDAVYELAKLNPRNFLCASDRLRKDVEFSKKIALLGYNALCCVDGGIRRNRELRPLKKLYGIAGDC